MVVRSGSALTSKGFLLLLGLVLAFTTAPTAVQAQQLVVSRGVSIDFDALNSTSTLEVSTVSPTVEISEATPAPAPETKLPAMIAPSSGSAAGSGSSFRDSTTGEPSNSTQPTMTPSVSPAPSPTPSTAVPVTPAPIESHNCDPATSRLITKLYENNDVLEGDCAAVNNYYRFPFDTVPSRAQLINMSKSASCTVLMQALLQLVPSECDFKRIPVRSTAEAILQLAKDLKSKGESAVLPSEAAITKAIEARRQDLLSTSGGSGSKATDDGAEVGSTESKTGPFSSGSSWMIVDGITSVDDDGQHILMDTDLLVVGTWSDNPDNYAGPESPSSASVGADADLESGALKLADTKTVAPTPTPTPATSTASGSLQFATLSVQAALALAWVFIQ
ncbi:hypothetical protein Gpo141_00009816 [Globisporangium polare]